MAWILVTSMLLMRRARASRVIEFDDDDEFVEDNGFTPL
jgi:hypothetical protein